MINGHGDDIYSFDTKITANFSSNIYTGFDMSDLEEYLCRHISSIHSYPEPDALSLRKIIAGKYGIASDNICITNGATEAIYLIAQTFRKSKTAIVIPTFSEYEDACVIHQHDLYFIDSPDKIEENTRLVWICNPNNPTGKIYDNAYLLKIISENPDTHFVIDQSYAAFSQQEALSCRDAAKFDNVILLHSLTKCYAIPGLRLGYITASAQLTEQIKYYSMPWSVNQIAQLAGRYLLQKSPYDYTEYISESKKLQHRIDKIEGIDVHFSDMHFFLCELHYGTSTELKKFLVEKYGILIRDASNFRGLDNRYFRIATQDREKNSLLTEAIEEWTKQSY